MTRPVEFVELAEHGERFFTRRGVQVAFAERKVAVWADDGPSSHAAVVSIPELFAEFADHLGGPDAEWLSPLLVRLQAGEDPQALRAEAVEAYRVRHGQEAVVTVWHLPTAHDDGSA